MDATRRERVRRAGWSVLPAAVYALAALAITWPLARHLTQHAAGLGVADTFEVTRHIWWAREALAHGHNPFNQTLLTYPHSFMSWLMWSHPLQYLPGALLAFVVSPLTAFNLMLLIVLTLNGLAAYRLGLALSGSRAGALLGGLVFEAFPTVQGHLSVGHVGIISLYGLPLFALCWWRVLFAPEAEAGSWRTVGWGGVWFAVTALAYVSQMVYVLLPLVLFSGLYALIWGRDRLIRRGDPLRHQPWLRAGAMLALGGLLLIPFYAPLLTDAGRAELRGVEESGRVAYSADVLAFVSPSPFGPLDDLGLVPDYARTVLGTNSAEGTAYLGVITLGLALLALARRRAARPWLAVALGAVLFSLGPLLNWRGTPVRLPIESFDAYVTLPWALLERLPFIASTRTPGRFNLATGLALSALVALGAGMVCDRLRQRIARSGLVTLLGAAILVEYQVFAPFPSGSAAQPEYFRALAGEADVRAVLNLPADNSLASKIGLYEQTIHHQALIAGHTLRRSTQDPALVAVLDRAAAGAQGDGLPDIPTDVARVLLSQAGADRVILHKQFYADPDAVVARLRAIAGDPDYEDGQIAVFAVPRGDTLPSDFTVAWAAGPDWSAPVTLDGNTGSFLAQSGTWYFYTAGSAGDVLIQSMPYHGAHPIAVWLDDRLITRFDADGSPVRLPIWTEPGYHTLRFEALDGCTSYPFAVECLAADLAAPCAPADPALCLSALFTPPTWDAIPTPSPLDVQLDGGLRLRGYSAALDAQARTLRVRLYWAAEGPLPHSYALFVHLADPQTAEPLAQFDGFPAVATDAWRGASGWVSEVQIDLPDDLPAGEYALNAGWFDPSSQTRLGVQGDRPWAAAGIVALGTLDVPPPDANR